LLLSCPARTLAAPKDMELAGGFRKGDRAELNGVPCQVVGPPAVAAAARFSLAIRFDDGQCRDVRASTLMPAGGGAEFVPPPPKRPIQSPEPEYEILPVQKPPKPTATFDFGAEGPPSMFDDSPEKSRLIPPKIGTDPYAWESKSKPFKRMTEDIQAPVGYVSGGYPTENFIKAVIEKDLSKNEHDAPDTQTICNIKGKYHKALPDDPKARQKELVRIYTMETQIYPQMNLALRQDHFQRMKYFGAFIKELRDVFYTDHIDQIIDPYIGACYRGITVPNVMQFISEYVPGFEFVWTSFTSTTANKEMAGGFGNLLFEIHCREPATGSFDDEFPEYAPADIKMFSDSKEESEILIPPNTRLRVITIQMPTRTNGLSCPMVVCETTGYDSIWGLIDAGNYGEIVDFCQHHYHLVQGDGYTHSILHAAIDSGDADVAEAVMEANPNFDQMCEDTGMTALQKLSVRFPSLSKRYESTKMKYDRKKGQVAAPAPIPEEPTAYGYAPGPADKPPAYGYPPSSAVKPPAYGYAPSMTDTVSSTFRASFKEDFTREELAGGFVKGDVVLTAEGAYGVVMGPPGKKALKNISVTVRFDTGMVQDVRVNKLRLAEE